MTQMKSERNRDPFDIFMAPESVAVIGASRKTGEGSFNVIENMLEYGFEGKVFPVNPHADRIMDLKAFRDVREINHPVDVAIVSTPREQVPSIVEACAIAGIRGSIVVPQGFADADSEGKALQHRLSQVSRQRGIRVLGPNTLGVANAFSGFTSSFMPLKRETTPVGVICQSGIFFVGSALFTGTMGKGIDLGNACDLGFCDALQYFGNDDDIRIIFVHIEGTRQGREFFQVCQEVAQRKPIIALKTARTRQGAHAASTHSGALVGQYEIFEAGLRQAGVISASDPEEVLDYTKVLLQLPPMHGNRVGIITFTGAGGIILIDNLEDYGLRLASLSPHTIRIVKALSPDWMPIQNPMDIWPALMKHGLGHVYSVALEAVLQDPEVDGVICIAIAPDLPAQSFLDATGVMKETAATFTEKPVIAWLYGPNQPLVTKRMEEGGHVISLPTLPRAARALGALRRRGQSLRRLSGQGPFQRPII
jgi:acyl-CoA synthetase (NDP forming)